MKKIITAAAVFMCLVSLCASDSGTTFLQDIGVRVGHGGIVMGEDSDMGLHGLVGMTFGISKYVEIDPEIMFEIMPAPFSDAVVGFEAGFAVLGNRISEKNNSGTGVNILINAGLFASNHGSDGRFLPTYLTLRVTPLTCGTSYAGRRESFLPIGVAWNFRENKWSLFMSVLIYDHYIKGTWRDACI